VSAATLRDLLGARTATVAGLLHASRLTQAGALALLVAASPGGAPDAVLAIAGATTSIVAVTLVAMRLVPGAPATPRRA
jgi:hypothetical protein